MTRRDKFLASAALYAADLSGLARADVSSGASSHSSGLPLYRYDLPVAWYRRRKGLDTANVGTLSVFTRKFYGERRTEAARRVLSEEMIDGRQGPHCRARWDGGRFWNDPLISLEQAQEDLRFLTAMLDKYPTIPPGYDGWWRF